MNKLQKYMIGILFLIIVSVLAIPSIVKADEDPPLNTTEIDKIKTGSTSTDINLKDMTDRNDLYCVQSGGRISKHHNISYEVDKRVYIDGNTAGGITSKWNGALAYIATNGGGYGEIGKDNLAERSEGQKAMYEVMEEWYANVGTLLEIGTQTTDDGSCNDIYNNAVSYAESFGAGDTEPRDLTNENAIRVEPYSSDGTVYMRVGPFKWNFSGTVSNLKAKVNGEKTIGMNSMWVSKYEGTKEIKLGSEAEIKSGENFYITFKANNEITTFKGLTATINPPGTGDHYTGTIIFLSSSSGQHLILTDMSNTPIPAKDINCNYKILLTKNLKIVKVDEDDNKIVLPNVKFHIQSKSTGKYLLRKGKNIEYVDKKDAGDFLTDGYGVIPLDNVIIDEYIIYEDENPNYGYVADEQEYRIPADCVKFVAKNKQKYVKISGYVWKDIQSEKMSKRNNLYKDQDKDSNFDTDDKAFNGISVNLVDENGNIKKTTKTKELHLYNEIDGGEYQFVNVLIKELKDYHIEFEYNGLIYQSVTPNIEKDNGSKASDSKERETLDKNFVSVKGTGEQSVNVGNGTYKVPYNEIKNGSSRIKKSNDYCIVKAKTNDKKANYALKPLFKPGVKEIRFINLGVYEKPQTDLAIMQDLYNVDVAINGHNHIYNYANRFNKTTDEPINGAWNMGVKFKGTYGKMSYQRAIYEADYKYKKQGNAKSELEVYLTYKVALRNEESYTSKINSVIQYYDSRYTIVGAGTKINKTDNSISGDDCKVSKKASDNSEYKKAIINTDILV